MAEDFQTLGDALSEFTGKKKYKNPVNEIRIINFWKELMGDLVDRYTEKIYLNRQTLFIKVGPDALKNELLYSRDLIIKKINLNFKTELVKKIVIL